MTPHAPALKTPVTERDNALGRPEAPHVLVEYGDYQCPYCGAAHFEVKRVLKNLGDQVQFVFRNFPLTQIHSHAQAAALAAMAAAVQGKFWEMHEMLFENQSELEPDDILSYAAALGLDMAQFAKDMESEETAARIQEDFLSGVMSGVNGTPTFFIDGVRHNGQNNFHDLKLAIEESAS